MRSQIEMAVKRYERDCCVVFRKTKDSYGGFSNMCAGYPIQLGKHRFLTSEALYQAFRFKEEDIQRIIMNEKSPMAAKMKSKKYRSKTREDWEEVRVDIMEWCLHAKLMCNWDSFSSLLLSTGDKEIVEDSHKDRFWGAVPVDEQYLEGRNILGKLLMKLRDDIKYDRFTCSQDIEFSNIENMILFSEHANDLAHNLNGTLLHFLALRGSEQTTKCIESTGSQ